MIGDPTGRSSERVALNLDEVDANARSSNYDELAANVCDWQEYPASSGAAGRGWDHCYGQQRLAW
jgi:hypothetical protein